MSQQYPQDPNAARPPQQPQYPAPGQQPYQGPPPGWQPPVVKKKHTARNVFIVLAVLGFLGIGGCVAIVGVIGKQADTSHAVVYKVTGTAGLALITYTTDGSTSSEQQNNVPIPWTSRTLSVKGLVTIYQVSAQNMSGHGGSIRCEIWEDGNLVKSATATGEASIASCDYTPQ